MNWYGIFQYYCCLTMNPPFIFHARTSIDLPSLLPTIYFHVHPWKLVTSTMLIGDRGYPPCVRYIGVV